MGVHLHGSMMDTACCAAVDIRVFSLSVDTSLYPVTLAWAIPTSALHCVVTGTVTSLRAHGILFGKIESVAHQPTVSSEIDRVTTHELLLWLSSDMSLRSCLLMLRFLERERDDYGFVSEIKLDLQDGRGVIGCWTSLLCSRSLDQDRQRQSSMRAAPTCDRPALTLLFSRVSLSHQQCLWHRNPAAAAPHPVQRGPNSWHLRFSAPSP